jgi:hypothetical protein
LQFKAGFDRGIVRGERDGKSRKDLIWWVLSYSHDLTLLIFRLGKYPKLTHYLLGSFYNFPKISPSRTSATVSERIPLF